MIQAIILAGGFGTRLHSRVVDLPKALAPVRGKPFLVYQLEWLKSQGISKVALAVHHLAEHLKAFVEAWTDTDLELECVYESEPLGTGGAVANVVQQLKLNGNILVMNGDTEFRFSLRPAISRAEEGKCDAMLIAAYHNDVSRYGAITVLDGRVHSFHQAMGIHESGIVNGGMYLFNAELFGRQPLHAFSLEYDLFPKLVKQERLHAYVVTAQESFFDIGTPDAYDEIIKKGGVEC